MTDKMREAFEAHITKEYGFSCNRWEDGEREYVVPKVQNMWLGWQAAQSVPVVGEVVAGAIVSEEGEWPQFTGTPNLFNLPVGDYSLIIKPTTSISAAELERRRKCEAVLVHVRSVLPMDKWADDSRRMIDAAIAVEETGNG